MAAGPAAALLDVTETGRGARHRRCDGHRFVGVAGGRCACVGIGTAIRIHHRRADRCERPRTTRRQRTAEVSSARLQAPWGSGSATGHLALDAAHGSGVEAARHGSRRGNADARARSALPGGVARRRHGAGELARTRLPEGRRRSQRHADAPDHASRPPRNCPSEGIVTVRGNGSAIVATLQGITAAGAQVNGRIGITRRTSPSGRRCARTSPT